MNKELSADDLKINNLSLKRPIAFFDLETTGIDIKRDRIVEICIIKFTTDGTKEKYLQRVNPEIPISPESSAIHGIYDEDVKDKPSFRELAQDIYNFFLDTDIGGYNLRKFDLALINAEFERIGLTSPFTRETKILDPMRIFHKMEKRDLAAAYQFYCGKELIGAHGAEADIIATIQVLDAQINRYELENDVHSLDDLCSYDHEKGCIDLDCKFRVNENGDEVFTFGANKDKKIKENLGMLKWMIDRDFSKDTKRHAKDLLDKFS